MTQAPEAPVRTRAQISERTFRTDPWWKTPRTVAAGLTIWVARATAFRGVRTGTSASASAP